MQKKVLFIWLIFSNIIMSNLHSMEKEEPQQSFSSEKLHHALAHHGAAMVIAQKLKATTLEDDSHSCLPIPCPQFMTTNIDFDPYHEFACFEKKYGQFDIHKVEQTLIDGTSLDNALKDYCEHTVHFAKKLSNNQLNVTNLRDSIQAMLTQEQSNFFDDNYPQLPHTTQLWIASRIALLETVREKNKKVGIPECVTEFCDHGCTFAPGMCTGFGIATCMNGQAGLGAIFILLGFTQCLNINGHCTRDLNLPRFSTYWNYKKSRIDNKLSQAINQLVLYANNNNEDNAV